MSKKNRAVPSVRTSRLSAIIAVSTILAISTAALACKPAPDRSAAPSPRSSARILTNQVGYEPLAAKRAVIQAHAGDALPPSPPSPSRAFPAAKPSSRERPSTPALSPVGKTGTSGRSIGAP